MNKLLRLIYSNKFFAVLTLLLQVGMIAMYVVNISNNVRFYLMASNLISVIFILIEVNRHEESAFKITWIMLMSVVPYFGWFFYLYTHTGIISGNIRKSHQKAQKLLDRYRPDDSELIRKMDEDGEDTSLIKYLSRAGGCPVFEKTKVTYYPIGEEMFKDMLEELEKAEKFIFMEFFVISPGYILDKLTKILKQKAEEGVEIKFLFDGSNEFFLDTNFFQEFKESGIEVKPFLPVRVILSTIQQNRDHRKIVVIDNRISYTGGVNIADEYANIYEKNGHWVDTGIKLVGEGTKSFTAMFLEMWYLNSDEENYKRYLEDFYSANVDKKSFLVPFGVNPFLDERIGENVYIDIINRSKNYVYISTPYLTITNKMLNALKLASQRGVDVKIVLPHI